MASLIHTPTNSLNNSLDFYQKLKFQRLSPNGPVQFSDGQVIIEINPDRFARAGLKLISDSWGKVAKQLEKLTTVVKTDDGYLASDPSGIWIYLVEEKGNEPANLEGIQPSVLGNFAGLSFETTSIQASADFYNLLGFSMTMGKPSDGWVLLKNEDGMGISLMKPLMCPHLFFNPSLTYFNGKNNPEIIAQIRKLGIPISEEITHFNKEGIVDNIIIRDPGGYGFFLFND